MMKGCTSDAMFRFLVELLICKQDMVMRVCERQNETFTFFHGGLLEHTIFLILEFTASIIEKGKQRLQ
jgi:hypothetical protein